MPQDMDSKRERGSDEAQKLDHGKLFGFRNLAAVTRPGSDMREAAGLAFNKRGGDGETPADL